MDQGGSHESRLDHGGFDFPGLDRLPGKDGDPAYQGCKGSGLMDIPNPMEFEGYEYIHAEALNTIRTRLLEECDEFEPLQTVSMDVFWKQDGGKSRGQLRYGDVILTNPMVSFLTQGTEAIIWLARDWCSIYELTDMQLEQLMYRQLCHLHYTEGKVKKINPDFAGFNRELSRYGEETFGLEPLGSAVKQLKLWRGLHSVKKQSGAA